MPRFFHAKVREWYVKLCIILGKYFWIVVEYASFNKRFLFLLIVCLVSITLSQWLTVFRTIQQNVANSAFTTVYSSTEPNLLYQLVSSRRTIHMQYQLAILICSINCSTNYSSNLKYHPVVSTCSINLNIKRH